MLAFDRFGQWYRRFEVVEVRDLFLHVVLPFEGGGGTRFGSCLWCCRLRLEEELGSVPACLCGSAVGDFLLLICLFDVW